MKTCKHCGKQFQPVHGRQTYCSSDCLMEANRKRSLARYRNNKGIVEAVKICSICGSAFICASNVVKYCSQECAKEANRRNVQVLYWQRKAEQAANSYEKIALQEQYFCDNCGKQFLRTGNERFCSACSKQRVVCHA